MISKDGKINGEGKKLVKYIREKGWSILNGEMESGGDKEGEWTYTGSRGKSVIDYVIINEEIRKEIIRLEVGDQVDSDHHLVIIKLRGKKKGENRKGGRGRKTGGSRGDGMKRVGNGLGRQWKGWETKDNKESGDKNKKDTKKNGGKRRERRKEHGERMVG